MKCFAAMLILSSQLLAPGLYKSSGQAVLTLHVEGLESCTERPYVRVVNLSDSEKEEQPLAEDTIQLYLERGDEYLISLCDLPAGLMPDGEIWLLGQDTRNDMEKTLHVSPFALRVFQHAEGMEVFAAGGKLEVRNEQDESVFEFEPDPEGILCDEQGQEYLPQAGQTYLLVQKEDAPGYQKGDDVLMEIPSFMEQTEEPLAFYMPLKELEDYVFPEVSEPQAYRPIHLPHQPDPDDGDDFMEEEEQTQETAVPAAAAALSRPAVYVTHTIAASQQKTQTAEKKGETGFRVRLSGADHKALSGASLAVYDSLGNPVDAWISTQEDHLVAGESLRVGETYTVKLLKPAAGYAADTVAVEHTALSVTDHRYPLIELSDHPRSEDPPQITETRKIKKTADGLVIAASVTSALAIGLVIAAALRHGTAK